MVGRQRIQKQIVANLKRKQNTLVVGPGGIGKSTLLKGIAAERGSFRAYYVEAIIPATAALREAYGAIGGFSDEDLQQMKVHRWTLPRLAKAMIQLLDGRDFVLLLDGLDRVTVASAEWLKALAESDVTLLGACRTVKAGKLIDRFFWTFETISLPPMPDKAIKEVIRQHVYPSDAADPAIRFDNRTTQRYFVERVIKAAKGIPLTAVEHCKRAMGVGEVSVTFIREHLMREYEASVKWVDATPILLVGMCIVMAMRYVARGMHNTDAYVFFGALLMLMIVVRMFTLRGSRKNRS